MSNLPILPNLQPKDNASLEELLLELSRFGKTGVQFLTQGWWCKCELYVTGAGVAFKVDSETNHKTPTPAARECLSRVLKSLKELGVNV